MIVAVAALLPPAKPVESPRTTQSPLGLAPTPTIAAPTAMPTVTPALASPSPVPFADEVVREGDLVSVTGQIINWSAGPVVCAWMAWNLSAPPQPGCVDSRAVPLNGIDPRDLPGGEWRSAHEGFKNVWVTNTFDVFGIWRDGVVEFVDAIPGEQPPNPTSIQPVPCGSGAECSIQELEAVAERLRAVGPEWWVEVGGSGNRLVVWLPVIDAAVAEALAQDSRMILAQPVVTKVDADPPSDGERFCGRVDQAHCAIAIALVREARPDLFTQETVEAVESECPPGARCSAVGGYIVAIAPNGCPGSPIAFVVPRLEQFDHVAVSKHALPAHVAELLPIGCAVDLPS